MYSVKALFCVRSKLASLFGMDQASRHGGNESLTYTAPKEPKKSKLMLLSAGFNSACSVVVRHEIRSFCGIIA